MQEIEIFQVDVFTDRIFAGNPAAVCVLERWIDRSLLQNIAAENNQSETAFIVAAAKGFEIRWFAPRAEVELCGHATLAAAFVVTEYLQPGLTTVKFYSAMHELNVRKIQARWEMDFPRLTYVAIALPEEAIEGLGVRASEAYEGNGTLVLLVENSKILAEAQPNLTFMKDRKIFLSLTCAADPGENIDFVSRFFAPSVGVDEDSATGSVHCLLGPLWSTKLAKNHLHARQLSKRGGSLSLEVTEQRVFISGQAVLYLRGRISLS